MSQTEEPRTQNQIEDDLYKLSEGEKKKLVESVSSGKGLQVVKELIDIFEGRPNPPKQLTDLDKLLERTQFPTYAILRKNVYLRLIAKLVSEGSVSCLSWADIEAEALISYKGTGREQEVEIRKNASEQNSQQFFLSPAQQTIKEEKKGLLNQIFPFKPKEENENE